MSPPVILPLPNASANEIQAFLGDLLGGKADLMTDEQASEFARALDLDVSDLDDRAVVEEVEVTGVEIEGDTLCIEYAVHFSVYYGCQDHDIQDCVERTVRGHRTAHGWELPEHVPLPKRVPSDDI